MSGPRLFLVAGEPSGDRLGAALMAALRGERPGVRFLGVGGALMREQGLDPLFPISDIAVMGLVEVLPRLRGILRRIDQTARAAIAARPDALVTIDSPDFTLRVAARVRAALPGLKVVHYVAPSVWAWRPGRARRMARHVDHVLALLPFEPPYMTAAGMGCDFVGHPAAELPAPDPALMAQMRPDGGPLLAVLPGSRRGEVRRLLPLFRATVAELAARLPGLAVVLPAAGMVAAEVAAAVADWPVPVRLLDPRGLPPAVAEARKFAAFAAADAALAASGTVVLELAAMGCPMVAAYRVNHLSSLIARHLLRVDSANLVNLLCGRHAVPEFLQEHARPQAMAAALRPLLTDARARAAQRAALDEAMRRVGRGGVPPSQRAAHALLGAIGRGGETVP
ncbi:MAG: lipid-A-disaccharide synthase [Paracoccaceae bacterium]|nr:MAG: lipid-A-disaccharide synthase [Paracoccaceae bacterium]